ncbi:MAG: endolytic transglycosylase MltG [Candidatus Cloacimonadaceae bacterium]|nr:endolytic transglycosylase MltG [Candidatus Cloacimonadota bacterium]MDX9949348.1 endolytic transglycosylase MltG [Candidatus Syntrophosphaera sp.]
MTAKIPLKKILIALPFVVILILITTFIWNMFLPLGSEQIAFSVKKGDNAAAIGKRLKERGVIRNAWLFRVLASTRGTDRRLIAGTYSLGGKHSLFQTLKLLEKGNVSAVKITFPEGLSLHKTLERIDRSGLAGYDELYTLATDSLFVQKLTGFKALSLEGFLYPETYFFDLGENPADILEKMTRQFFKKLNAAGIDATKIHNFYDLLIKASIVEKESMVDDERPLVASVIENRLNAGMRLESCPTVDYIMERQGVKKTVLSIQDTQIQSPYNTYRNHGLPPSPICNPSLNSIQATLQAPKTDFFFFVADRKGHNDFSATGEEHMRKAAAYKRQEWE